MKFSLALFVLSAASVNAFAPSVGVSVSSTSTALFATVDTRSAVRNALDISKKFGVTSPEARVAWDTVEEIRANDDSPAMGNSLDEECDVVEPPSPDCLEYGEKLDELYGLLKATSPASILKQPSEKLKNVQIPSATAKPGKDSPAIQNALKEAKEATKKFGATSPEARLAWETLEEIDSSGLDNAMGGSLTEECLVDAAMDACLALEELQKLLDDGTL